MGLINLTVTTLDDGVFPLQIDDTLPIAELRGMVQMISGIPESKLQLLLGQQVVPKNGTVSALNIRDGDLIQAMPQSDPFALGQDGSAQDPEAFIAALRQSPDVLQRLAARSPELEAAVSSGNTQQLQNVLRQMMSASAQARAAAEQIPEGDPLDPEYQQKMYEAIQQKNIEENFQHAMEHSPEVFATVDMLYVDMAVNGEPVKAFIDSGAQMTIMTQTCAEKCRIMRLVDKRFAGVAMGVGSSKIIGRIHTCSLKVGDQFITTSVTVLEQKDGPQFIFGLDNLKRHQCCVDLKSNLLRLGSCSVNLPFLPANQVPQDFNTKRVNESEVDELDATGTIKGSVTGDVSSLHNSGSLPGNLPDNIQTTTSAGTSGPQGSGFPEEQISQIQSLTGASRDQCIEALTATGGNADAAVAVLLGL